METTFRRVQMLLEPEQHEALRAQARASGVSVAELTRRVIQRGLEVLQSEAMLTRREEALQRARLLRQRQAARGPTRRLDVSADLEELREEHDLDSACRR